MLELKFLFLAFLPDRGVGLGETVQFSLDFLQRDNPLAFLVVEQFRLGIENFLVLFFQLPVELGEGGLDRFKLGLDSHPDELVGPEVGDQGRQFRVRADHHDIDQFALGDRLDIHHPEKAPGLEPGRFFVGEVLQYPLGQRGGFENFILGVVVIELSASGDRVGILEGNDIRHLGLDPDPGGGLKKRGGGEVADRYQGEDDYHRGDQDPLPPVDDIEFFPEVEGDVVRTIHSGLR